MAEKLSGTLQENLLVLCCYSDTASQLIRNSVPVNLFTTDIYRDIMSRVYDYIDQFRKPPKDHLPDLLEDVLETKKGRLYRSVLEAVHKVHKTLNEEYVITQLDKFVRLQGLKVSIIKASSLMQEGKIEEAEVALSKGLKDRLALFNPGLTLLDAVRLLEHPENLREPLLLGIPGLDKAGLGPARKEFHLLIGPKKAGKTWWLLYLAKRGLLSRLKVAYISLEVREALASARSLQSLFSLTLNNGTERISVTRFKKDDLGRVASFEQDRLKRMALLEDDGRSYARKQLNKFYARNNIRIKDFPSGSLTLNGLEAYLDALERVEKFVPDLVLVDYTDLMRLDPRYLRQELGAMTVGLRGIAVDRNIMMASVSQVNREGVKSSKILTSTDAAEDFSKSFTADVVLSFNQTPAEYHLGLARLHVSDSRISKQHFSVMISQAYDIGQFCMDSAPMLDSYWDNVKQMSGRDPMRDEELNGD